MKNRTGYIYKRGNVYWLRFQIEGKVFRQSLETSLLEEAEKKQRAIIAPIVKAGMDSYIHQLQNQANAIEQQLQDDIRNMPLAELWPNYLKCIRRPDSGPATLKMYQGQCKHFVDWCVLRGLSTSSQVSTRIAEEYFSGCLSTSSSWNAGTWNKHLGFLKLLWRTLFDKSNAEPFNTIAVRRHSVQSFSTLDESGVEKLAGAAAGVGPGGAGAGWGDLVRVGACSGLRLVDCVRLRAGDWDRAAGLLRVVPQKTGRRVGRAVLVPVLPGLFDLLARLLPVAEFSGGWFFPAIVKLYDQDRARVSRVFSLAARRAGLVGRVSFHSLRHSFASRCRLAGVPEAVLQGVLGHSSAAITRAYVHIGPDDLRAAV